MTTMAGDDVRGAGDSPSGMRQIALSIDLERCTGCRSCEAACKLENRLGNDMARNRVLWMQYKGVPRIDPTVAVCQQCERPACVRACASTPKAVSKSPVDGVVRIDPELCTGCQECVKACPYNAISFDFRQQKAQKCDLCFDRREHGFKPACVSVCPGRALDFGPVDELLARAQADGRKRRTNDHFGQNPSTVYLERIARVISRPEGGGVRAIEPWPAPEGAYVSSMTREGAGKDHGRKGVLAPALGKLPRMAASREQYPYSGAPRIWEADRVANGGCNICFNSCSTKYYLKDGKVIAVTGNENDPILQGRICPKPQMQMQQFYSPHRMKHPMKRVGERGEGKFTEIGWDEALDEVAEKMKEIRDRYGPESVAIYNGTRTGMMTRFGVAAIFATMFGTPNREGTGPFCGTSSEVAFPLVQGFRAGANSYTPEDVGSAQFYMFFGDNMAESRPVYFGAINDWRLKNRARMVVVDPRMSMTANKADEWLPIRAGTDMALALGMIHYVVTHDLVDHAFVDKWVVGYPEVSRFVLEKGYTPEWAEGVTGIPRETIERLAHEYATTDRAMMWVDRGITQHSNGVQSIRAVLMLCAITGHLARKGAGCMVISSGLPILARAPQERLTPYRRPAIRKSPAAWIDAMETGRPYPLKALIASTNPFVLWPDQAQLRRAILNLDLFVHMELWRNETSAWADYLFPAANSIEMGETNRNCEDRRLVWIEKLVDPPGEARPDTHFFIDLGKRFGYDDVLKPEYKNSELLWNGLMLSDPRIKGMTLERMRRSPYNWVRGPLPTEDSPEPVTLCEEGSSYPGDTSGKRFPTPSGKVELWTAELESMFNAVGLTALPEFYSEREQLISLPHIERLIHDTEEGNPSPFWPNTNAGKVRIVQPTETMPGGFDTELVTGRPPAAHFHGWTHFWWQSQEMWPDLYVQIHPEKAEGLGIRDGDRVVVESPRGSIEAVAWLYSGIRKTSVFIPIGWGERQPYNPWKGPNWLIARDQRDPASDQTNFKATLCRVRKA